ncbi:MAG: hypothetical protein CME36_12065 [unclassified Hahellaceae]|nr:hypothetical protein [Hahellaceae bacterium]|tara:strand:- start:3570 stop:3923 length:354 start_codon:yes stop_codon:yes gene_type:complete
MLRKVRKKTVWRGIVGALVVGIIIWVLSFSFIRNSAIYTVASKHIAESSSVETNFGPVRSLYMMPWGISYRVNGVEGKSSVKFFVVGADSSGFVEIYLGQEYGIWEVKNEVNGHQFF